MEQARIREAAIGLFFKKEKRKESLGKQIGKHGRILPCMITLVVAMPGCGASVLRQSLGGNFSSSQLVGGLGTRSSDCLAMASASRSRGEVGVANQG